MLKLFFIISILLAPTAFANVVWKTDWKDVDKDLPTNPPLVVDIDFTGRIVVEDGFWYNDEESIHIDIEHSTHSITVISYKFWFTDVIGDLITGTQNNPITGSFETTAGNGTPFTKNLQLTNATLFSNGKFSFGDIHVELQNIGNHAINIDRVRLGVDADYVSASISRVPLPASWSLILGGIALFKGLSRKRVF